MQGLKVLVNKTDSSYDYLSSLCSHPALYKLQRTFGHEPQKEIDRRAAHNIALVRSKSETNDMKANTESALQYADDMINCSRSHRTGLERILDKKLPRTAKIVNKILDLESARDLSQIEEVLPFSKEVVKTLDLVANWSESNDLERMREQLAELKSHDK